MEKLYPVLGHSMRFLLEPGDLALACPCPQAELSAGEIALLIKWEAGLPAGYIIHRVLLNAKLGGRRLLLTKGDANFLPDLPPSSFQAVARITAISRAGRTWSASPGPVWPLAAAYSFFANKLLSWTFYSVFFLASAAAICLPRFFSALLNTLYLYWETRLYPTALRLISSVVRPVIPGGQTPAAGAVKSGLITAHETWSGKITVADYVVIERGVRITVEAGSEINFTRRGHWFVPVLRIGEDGTRRELDSFSAKILVYGGFSASGTPDSPVIFRGGSFGGLHALNDGKISLRDCRLENSEACALTVRDRATAELDCCSFTSCRGGTEASGFSFLFLKDCFFEDSVGPALRLLDNSLTEASGCAVRGSAGPAVEIGGEASASLCSFLAENCASGIEAAALSVLKLVDCRFERNSGYACQSRGGVRLEAANCRISDNAAGFFAHGGNSLRLSSCVFNGGQGPAVELCGHNSLEAGHCTFSGGASGIEGVGLSSVRLSSCSFISIQGHGVELERAVIFYASSCVFSGCGAGMRFKDCRTAGLERVSVSGGRGPAVELCGRNSLEAGHCTFSGGASGIESAGVNLVRISSCHFSEQSGWAAVFSGKAEALVTASSFSGNVLGVYADGSSSLDFRGCVFKNNGGPSLEMAGRSTLSLLETVSSGSPAALVLSGRSSAVLNRCESQSSSAPAASLSGGAELRGRDCSFTSETDAVYAEGSGALLLHSCRAVSASGAALKLGIKRAELERVYAEGSGGLNLRPGGAVATRDLKINARDYAIESAADKFSARGLEARGGARGGVLISSGRAIIKGASLAMSPYPGLAVAPGAVIKVSGVYFEGRLWGPPPRPASRPRRLMFMFASVTAGLPGFRLIYRLIYLAAVPAARVLLCIPGVSSLYLYRGMASPGWIPALSDMDLACALDYSGTENDWAVYSKLRTRLRLLKALFPFTGEVLCAGRKQLPAFIAAWGIKGAEFNASARLLAGRPLARAADAGGTVADETEAFYSYTLLMHHLFSDGLPGNFRRRNCLKGLVDIKRFLDKAAPERISRPAYAANAGLPLERYASAPEFYSAFEAFRALHSAAKAYPAIASCMTAAAPVSAPSPGFNRHAFEAACAGLEAGCGVRLSVVLDALYRVYIIIPDSAAGDETVFSAVAGAMRRARSDSPFLSAAPLLLTCAAFEFLSRLPYLNNPLFPLDLSGNGWGDGESTTTPLSFARGSDAPGHGGVYVYNLPSAPSLPSAAALRAGAALAARHFSVSWRSLWEDMPPHYFYTRAAGLRLLLEKGEAPPFSRPAELSAAFRMNYGGSAPDWETYLAGGSGRENYLFISSQTEALTELADEI